MIPVWSIQPFQRLIWTSQNPKPRRNFANR